MLSLRRVARVAEQVDAQDLKSCCQQWQYGFDSRPGHKMYWVYALRSIERNYIYVGLTSDLIERVHRHNSGYEKTTKPYSPFILVYKEQCEDRNQARAREKYWKSGAGKSKLRLLTEPIEID